MIGRLRGEVIDVDVSVDPAAVSEVLLDVSGVGYRVIVAPGTLASAGGASVDSAPKQKNLVLHTHHYIREADQRLYGFATKADRETFEGLLAAHGVGPSLAMAVLATHSIPQLARILADEDLQSLCEVPGVGKKTAQRLLIELKTSLTLPALDESSEASVVDLTDGAGVIADVREALGNLGYTSEEVRKALEDLTPLDPDSSDSGTLLRLALLNLGKA